MKSINSYNTKAEEWTKRIRSGKNYAHSHLEKPAMYGKILNFKNKTVLCIGCGSGEECAHLMSLGAKKIIGIDLSRELIAIAKKSYPNIEFLVMDMAKLKFPNSSFDFIYSSLAMHYLKDWRPTLKSIHKILKPKGTFLFSTHHPVYWSADMIKEKSEKSRLLGYSKKNNRLKKIYGDYQNSHKINEVWFGSMEVSYYHKPIAEIIHEIMESGFEIKDFTEPKPKSSLKKSAQMIML